MVSQQRGEIRREG
ncbi:MAG: hypothetical protein EZS28_039135, partial [Streblomastix strix]